MAGLQTRGFSLSTLPQAANFDVSNQINRGNQALSNSILQAGSAIGGMVSENRERDRIAEAEEKEANRLNSINEVALGLVSNDADSREQAKIRLKSLSPTEQAQALQTSMGIEQDKLILGEAYKRADKNEKAQAVENLSKVIGYDVDSKTFTVNIEPERFARAPLEVQEAAKQLARERTIELGKKEADLVEKEGEIMGANERIFGSPKEAETFFGKEVITKPAKDGKGVVVTSITTKDIASVGDEDRLFGFDIDTDERTIFNTIQDAMAADKAFPLPVEGETKAKYIERVRGDLEEYIASSQDARSRLLDSIFGTKGGASPKKPRANKTSGSIEPTIGVDEGDGSTIGLIYNAETGEYERR